jgi:alcohol dehydrogenase class IV
VGRAAVITHTESHEKKIIFHPKMMPRVVISDPELTVGLPAHVTVATGMDAFVHCFEAYCAPGFHPLADGIALEGMRLVKDYLPRAVENGADIEARAMLLAAASMGATAFQKGLGGVHALAHPVGATYDTHHGMTNAVILPYVIVFNKEAISPRIGAIARALDLPDQSYEGFLAWVVEFRRRLKVPATLRELKVDEEKAEAIGIAAAADPSAGSNPRPVTAADCERIFRAAVKGDLTLGA